MKNAFLVSASLLLCCGCGAEQYTDEAVSKRFSAEVQAIADSLVAGEIKYCFAFRTMVKMELIRMGPCLFSLIAYAKRDELAEQGGVPYETCRAFY